MKRFFFCILKMRLLYTVVNLSGKLTHGRNGPKDNKGNRIIYGVLLHAKPSGPCPFSGFCFCGLVSISACCLGVFGVIVQDSQTLQTAYHVLSTEQPAQTAVQAVLHPMEKEWEPVFILSQYESRESAE